MPVNFLSKKPANAHELLGKKKARATSKPGTWATSWFADWERRGGDVSMLSKEYRDYLKGNLKAEPKQ